MASRRAHPRAEKDLSDRQRYWLKHLRVAEGKGEPLTEYAQRLGLSKHSLYEAKRRLRELGVIAPVLGRRVDSGGSPRFTRVAVSEPAVANDSPLRVRLSSGAVLEWREAPRGEALRELVGLLCG